MVRKTFLALSAVLLTAAASQAAIIVNVAELPTTAKAGFVTDTLTATAGVGEKIIGFDFVGSGSGGFNGAMNQVNPFGLATIFADNNAVIPAAGATPDNDSQFPLLSSTGISVNTSESANALKGAFNLDAAHVATATNVLAFAQICRALTSTIPYVGTLTVQNAQGVNRLENVQGTLGVPEPATLSLIGLAMVGGLGLARRRNG